MVYNYKIRITLNKITKQTTYEAVYKNKIMRFEYIFGNDIFTEILYFFSLHLINPTIMTDKKTGIYVINHKFIFYKYYKNFENSLFTHLLNHKCEIV